MRTIILPDRDDRVLLHNGQTGRVTLVLLNGDGDFHGRNFYFLADNGEAGTSDEKLHHFTDIKTYLPR